MKNDETKLIIELIKMNEQNSNKKLDSVNDRLIEHLDDNRSRFEDIKEMVSNVDKHIDKMQDDLYEKTIKPMQLMLNDHNNDINKIKMEQSNFIKKEICEKNEKMIKEYFWNITKKIVVMNICFAIFYLMILYSSGIPIDFGSIGRLIKFLF